MKRQFLGIVLALLLVLLCGCEAGDVEVPMGYTLPPPRTPRPSGFVEQETPAETESVLQDTAVPDEFGAADPNAQATEPPLVPAVVVGEEGQDGQDGQTGQEGEMFRNPVVSIEVRGMGQIVVELYPESAPNPVANFITLAQSGFYDGLTFHRIIPGFMIQGGDPLGTGLGGPGYSIKGEFAANGVENDLKHTRGVLSMARSQAMDSAGSQFFIMHADAPHLDGQYAAFGLVRDGMDVVDAIATVQTDANDKPLEDVVIEKMTVETYGVEYVVEKIQ